MIYFSQLTSILTDFKDSGKNNLLCIFLTYIVYLKILYSKFLYILRDLVLILA